MAITTIAGNINSDGSIYQNPTGGIEGINKVDTGEYIVQFKSNFKNPPVVIASQNYPKWDAQINTHGSSLDNVVVVFVNKTSAGFFTGSSNGNAQDRNFTFIAVGETA